MILCILVVTVLLPKHARFRFEFEKGKIWKNKDLISPYSFAIGKTPEEIARDKEEVLKSVLPVYQNNLKIPQYELEAFATDFDLKWNSLNQNGRLKDDYKDLGQAILTDIYSRGVMSLSKKYQRNGNNYNFTLLTNNVSRQLNSLEILTIDNAVK